MPNETISVGSLSVELIRKSDIKNLYIRVYPPDGNVAVTAPEELRVQRLMARDGISEDYARSRISAQRKSEEFEALCDYTLVNDGSEAAFREKCLAFFLDRDIIKP